jgi:hypothetical protein
LAPFTVRRSHPSIPGHNYFDRLAPILCTVASRRDPRGIVRL